MSLSVALNNALTGLAVNQRALSVISHNVANANTEGYSRQEVDLSAVYLGETGSGVQVDDVTRKIDLYLQRALRRQTSIVGRTETIEDYMERMQVLLGRPGEANSIDEHITTFFTALQNLAETPERTSFREQAVDSGVTLAREISDLASNLEDLRYQADRDIALGVDIVNAELKKLDLLNTAIARADALGNPKAGLLDQQDISLKLIAEYMDIDVYTEDTGEIQVFGPQGVVLLDDTLYQLTYSPASDTNSFVDGTELQPLQVVPVDENGEVDGQAIDLISEGFEDSITTKLTQGKFKALQELRDETIPNILAQLDELAATLRDAFNAIHNDGSSYPGTNTLTGTRALTAETRSDWDGSVTIAVLDGDGTPVDSVYSDESYTGVRPLQLDMTFLDSGYGAGQPSLQTVIDEINNHFYPPPVKTVVGNLNSIQLVSDTDELPGTVIPQTFSFDFDLENISAYDALFYVTNIQVFDAGAVNITNVSTQPPNTDLSGTNTFITTNGSQDVVITTSTTHTFAVGDRVYITDPAVAVNGIPSTSLNGFFEITAVTGSTFTIQVDTPATATGGVNVAAMEAYPPWDTIEAGEKRRVRDTGTVELDLSANPNSAYFDIVLSVAVDDQQDLPENNTTAVITYRIYNNLDNLLNDRYNSTDISGNGERIVPASTQPYLRAMMVDEDGNEVASVDGVYLPDRTGYLKLVTTDSSHTVAIDENDSEELGITTTAPTRDGTNRGFSHYFELNNFFASNEPIDTGDTLNNSAINLAVESRFLSNANLMSAGNLLRSNQSADPDVPPIYTYERYSGDNGVLQSLAALGATAIGFDTAGGLASTTMTFGDYSGQVLGYSAAFAAQSEADNANSTILRNGFQERTDAFSGVNIDEEMANTIIFQNAYTASARIITVTNEMFDALLNSTA